MRAPRFRLHAGTASILLVFLTLCLASFAALTLSGAKADLRLSEKLASRTQAYYAAVGEAEAYIAALDRACQDALSDAATKDDYFAALQKTADVALTGDDHIATKAFPISDLQSLIVSLELIYPEPSLDAKKDDADAPSCYRILSYHVQTNETALDFDEKPLNLPH